MRSTGEYLSKAILGAFAGTLVISALLWLQHALNLLPHVDFIQSLSNAAGRPDQPAIGWLIHFILNTLIWGSLFGLLSPYFVGRLWLRGMEFALIGWLAMMLIAAPLGNHELFYTDWGIEAPVWSLVLHIVFGAVMGAVYSQLILQRSAPAAGIHSPMRS